VIRGKVSSTQLVDEKLNKKVAQNGFGVEICSLNFRSKGALATYPVASSFTAARYPETFTKLEAILSNHRTWMNIHLRYNFPKLFSVIFDAESLVAYERIYSMIMKVLNHLHLSFLVLANFIIITDSTSFT
jgi:hypothetical protein